MARIKVNDLIGEWLDSEYGTSAGTVLGAILFLCYVHDTPLCIFPKFADDLVSISVAGDIDMLEVLVQNALDQMVDWADEWDMLLNVSKTKLIVFGNGQRPLSVSFHDRKIEQVSCIKYLGVWLDEHLNFNEQAEYAVGKAMRAFGKIRRLIDGRDGITPQTGIMLYKSLVRPHWEFSIAAWATVAEKGIQSLETAQARCLRSILGAKAHSSADAIDIIANITPVRLRIQEVCTLEYLRIIRKPLTMRVRCMLENASVQLNRFTPMSYLKYQSKFFRRITDNADIEAEYVTQLSDVLDDTVVTSFDIIEDHDHRNIVCPKQSFTDLSERVETFVDKHRHQSVIIFTDGATSESEVGRGSAAAVILQPDSVDDALEVSEVLNRIVDSIEAEISAIALALEASVEHFRNFAHRYKVKHIFILTDCKPAIAYIVQRSQSNDYHSVLARVRVHLHTLHSMDIQVSVAWIPGHSGICYNERADMAAKEALRLDNKIVNGSITLASCKRLVAKHISKQWQTRWERSSTGRATYALIPTVGHRVQFPHTRSCAVSYTRLLLDDTALNAHQFRMGLSSTRVPVCECGTDIEDVDHYLLRCPKYNSIRSDLLKSVQDIVTYCTRSSNQGLTASLLLSPWNCEDASKYDCSEILAATFQFIHKSTRQL